MKEAKLGRPTDAVKGIIIKARIDQDTEQQLEYCIEKTGNTKSGLVRKGILKIYEELKGENE